MNALLRPLLLALLLAPLAGCGLLFGAAAGYTAACADYDTTDDEALTETEFATGLYDDWDTDADGLLTEAEWGVGLDTNDEFGAWGGYWDTWDTDDDAYLDEDEFTTGFYDAGLYDTWDADLSGDLDFSECDDVL